MPQTAVARVLEVRAADLADGRTAAVVTYAPVSATGLRCASEPLREACNADVVVLHPLGTDLPELLAAATACDADRPVLATPAPVTDAIKRVDGMILTDTVDRTSLAWVVGPGVVYGPALRDVLAGPDARPLWDLQARIGWL